MQEKKVYVAYDKGSGELVINWDHTCPGYYEPVDQEEGPIWISIKRDPTTGEAVGVMVENFDAVADGSLSGTTIRDFAFTSNAHFDIDDEDDWDS